MTNKNDINDKKYHNIFYTSLSNEEILNIRKIIKL